MQGRLRAALYRVAARIGYSARNPRTRPMPLPDIVDQRLTDLEIKASFTEDLVDRLNEIIVRQQAQLEQLQREIAALREQARAAEPTTFRSLRDELPPHY
jgi:SlyX protein